MMIARRITKKLLTFRTALFGISIFLAVLVIFKIVYNSDRKTYFKQYDSILFSKINGSHFEGFDNETGTKDGSNIVPNHVHFLIFRYSYISYVHAVCVLAAFKNQRPEKIYFHTNVDEFSGPHWIKVRDTLGSVLEIRNVTLPTEIFGQELSRKYHLLHASDITRIRILMTYGGIFLDNDSFIVRSLDPFRKFEMTIGITDGHYLGTQVLVANKDARFLKLWLESYSEYKSDNFYYNAGQKPMREILQYKPELVHTVNTLLGVHGLADRLYIWDKWDNWRQYHSIHLIIGHRNYMDTIWNYLKWPQLNEKNICNYPKPFGVMAREIYSDFCKVKL